MMVFGEQDPIMVSAFCSTMDTKLIIAYSSSKASQHVCAHKNNLAKYLPNTCQNVANLFTLTDVANPQ
jgi:hypothetical protein